MLHRSDTPIVDTQRPTPTDAQIRLLFVCRGNICRSPMAAALAQKVLEGRARAESAGIAPFGSCAAPETIHLMQHEGIDLSDHRPTDVAELVLDEYTYVVAMDSMVHRYLKTMHRVPLRKLIDWEIPDPYGEDMTSFRRSLEAIRSHLTGLLAKLGWSPREEGSEGEGGEGSCI